MSIRRRSDEPARLAAGAPGASSDRLAKVLSLSLNLSQRAAAVPPAAPVTNAVLPSSVFITDRAPSCVHSFVPPLAGDSLRYIAGGYLLSDRLPQLPTPYIICRWEFTQFLKIISRIFPQSVSLVEENIHLTSLSIDLAPCTNRIQ